MQRRVAACVLAGLGGLVLAALWLPRAALPARLGAPTLPGRIAYAVGGNIWLWQGGAQRVTSSGHDGAPALSADGTRLAYVRYDDSFSDLLVAPTAGGAPQFLTKNRPAAETGSHDYVLQAVWALQPAWAPAGDRLAYTSDRGTDAPVLWISADSGADAHSLQTKPSNPPLEHPRWAPDGSAIVATSMGSGKDEIWRLDLGTATWNEVAAPADGAYDPAWAPDGNWVAYAARSGRQTDIWANPADRSSPPVQLTHLGRARAPVFSPDGRHLAFIAAKDDHFQIFVLDLTVAGDHLTAGSPQQVTDGESVDAPSGLSWSK